MAQSSMPRTAASQNWRKVRQAILERDEFRCTCCSRPESVVESFHVDHGVPRGQGGSDRFRNLRTLCKRCHKAKHGDGYAPMLEFQSSGQMDEYTFAYWRHFFDEILPAMGRQIGINLDPKYKIDGSRKLRFVPLGDMQLADAKLAATDEEYATLQLAEYM